MRRHGCHSFATPSLMVRLDSAPHTLAAFATLRGRAGRAHEQEPALEDLPIDLQLLVLDGRLTIQELAELHAATHGTRLADFRVALADGQLEGLRFLDRVARALPEVEQRRRRTPLGRARPCLDATADSWQQRCPALERLEPVGSVRRFVATAGDLSLLAAASDPDAALAQLMDMGPGTMLHVGRRRIVVRMEGTEISVDVVTPDRFGPALLRLTGAAAHVEGLRQRAVARGLRLATPRDAELGGDDFSGQSEAEIYAALELPFIPPEMREGTGEIDAAANGALPNLITRRDIRGDLHMHSNWSDGRDSLDAMINAARALGYAYVAVTDHSVSSMVAGGLDANRLQKQREAIERARETYPDIEILHGSEVDILPDGRLDFPDAVLERLDVVLASLHDSAGHTRERLTDRYISAMRHPLVHIVTHPTNRLVPSREGYELDEVRLFEAARDTGTILEIDGAPGHLDMDGAMARRAIQAGVMVSVDGDCHRADLLGRHMDFAVATARRGWVEAAHAVNTRPLPELRSLLARKRQGA
jgi:DNA polymerase (family 10)